jgi:hypothetical protein
VIPVSGSDPACFPYGGGVPADHAWLAGSTQKGFPVPSPPDASRLSENVRVPPGRVPSPRPPGSAIPGHPQRESLSGQVQLTLDEGEGNQAGGTPSAPGACSGGPSGLHDQFPPDPGLSGPGMTGTDPGQPEPRLAGGPESMLRSVDRHIMFPATRPVQRPTTAHSRPYARQFAHDRAVRGPHRFVPMPIPVDRAHCPADPYSRRPRSTDRCWRTDWGSSGRRCQHIPI